MTHKVEEFGKAISQKTDEKGILREKRNSRMENLNKINMKINSINVKLKKTFLILMFFLVYSCGHSNGQSNNINNSNHKFQSHDEVLQVFKDIMIDKYLVSKSNTGSKYKFWSGIGSIPSDPGYNLVEITIQNDDSHSFDVEEPHECVFYQGRFEINRKPTSSYHTCYIGFHLPKGEPINVSNILKHNELLFRDETGFIRLNYSQPRGSSTLTESLLGNGVNIINGNGVLLRDNGYISYGGYYLKNYIKDTIEYSKKINGKFHGRSFKANIVYLKGEWYEVPPGHQVQSINPFFNGETVKYLESSEDYNNGMKSGEQIYRSQGIVTKMEIYENGNFTKRITYSQKVFPSESHSLLEETGDRGLEKDHFLNFLWSNQDKFKIDEDVKGYKSYSPLVEEIENRKGFNIEGYGLGYLYHGIYEKNQFRCRCLEDDGPRRYGDWIPEIRANYNQGELDGNVLMYDRYGNELINAYFKNGILSTATENEYSESDDEKRYISKTSVITNNTINWKTFDSNGVVLDEGFWKVSPNHTDFSGEIISKEWGYWENKGLTISSLTQINPKHLPR